MQESVWPRFRTQPDPEPKLPPSTAENARQPPTDVEGPPTATSEPESKAKGTEFTITRKWSPRASLTGVTAVTTIILLLDLHLLFKDSIMSDMDDDLLIAWICVDCALLTFIMYSLMSPPLSKSSASPPAPLLLEACSPAPYLEMPCRDVEPWVKQPSAAPAPEDPVAPPLASDPFAPSRPDDQSAPPGTLDLVAPEELYS
ncbi:hypothetical protein DPX16_9710 [Anabarilius grahami]|uniref:Uncharacterized protein n=1 Tax=Anabarilius grahami TaxID=495550 RepID=A0A3N0Y3E4_ANAGA|nr:hypothetical protein DPX16_9710 [Anabarilius grahami]